MSFFNDLFAGTAGTDLTAHTPDSGGSWTKNTAGTLGGTFVLTPTEGGSQSARSNSASVAVYLASTAPAGADYDVQADIYVASVSGSMITGLAGRIANATTDTMYGVDYEASSSKWEIYKRVAGTFTSLALSSVQTLTPGTTYTLKLQMRGTTLTGFVNGVQFAQVTDSSIISKGSAGLFSYQALTDSTGLHVKNFAATDASAATLTIAPDNAALKYSPYNWNISHTVAKTVNTGAYMRTIFTGTSVTLTFDLTGTASPVPNVLVRIDGGAWVAFPVGASVTITNTLSSRNHLLEMVFGFMHLGQDRWTTPVAVVALTGVVIDSTASVSAPPTYAKYVLFYGDSIPEGDGAHGNWATDANNDAVVSYAFGLRRELEAEVGVVAFSGTGYTASAGNVPQLTTSYNLLYSGVSRVFTPTPDLAVYAEGQNDSAASDATVTANAQTVIDGIGKSSTKHAVCIPLSQNKAAALRTAVTNEASSNVSAVETSGWGLNLTAGQDTQDGIHPYDAAHQAKILPQMAAALFPILNPPNTGGLRRVAMTGGIVG